MKEARTERNNCAETVPLRSLKALAEGYEKADDYNKPAIEFYLRRVYAFFTSKT